ncbi:lipopolysaccharide biosynthesis protein [Sphingomonas turrisvirgatae]|uniref:Polysaccharide biosynthesis protein n=1 Tax=Sphingomonas turrisvirgatae TaxID=1888892 RepID=A0A1E3LV37_9SPHN|nr:oligosaccharide flippase family protein [Sphingomonas turrisvirgatae]ODP37579.1 polysaccharide biosynthesis protein [Sphingomonas turrisvirgatae]
MSDARGSEEITALAKGGRTNILGFILRLAARLPFLFIAGRLYGPEVVGRFAIAVVVVELAALLATLGLKRGLAQALASTERPHVHVVWDGMAVAFTVSIVASAVLFAFPQIMFPNSPVMGMERLLALIVFAVAWSDISLAALAYRGNVKAAVTARAVVEPWTISIAAFGFFYVSSRDGLIYAYVLSMLAALTASLVPFIRSYGVPTGWSPRITPLLQLATRNVPLAGADAIEWGTRNIDRFILGLLFPPAVVGIYYMAQQVSSIPQKLKTSFDPVLGPSIARNLAAGNRAAIGAQIKQVAFWIITLQMALLLMLGIPAEGVMGIVGPQFVAGSAALCFLLAAEVLASPGAIAEAGLVYVARMRNLIISLLLLAFQAALSFALVLLMRNLGWGVNYQAAGPAVALAFTVLLASTIKCSLLSRLLGARTFGLRPAFFAAAGTAALVGSAFTALPRNLEWLELSVGIPAIFAAFFLIIGKWALSDEDRKLFKRLPKEGQPA